MRHSLLLNIIIPKIIIPAMATPDKRWKSFADMFAGWEKTKPTPDVLPELNQIRLVRRSYQDLVSVVRPLPKQQTESLSVIRLPSSSFIKFSISPNLDSIKPTHENTLKDPQVGIDLPQSPQMGIAYIVIKTILPEGLQNINSFEIQFDALKPSDIIKSNNEVELPMENSDYDNLLKISGTLQSFLTT